eukprot:12339551-Ditylum_brightwellii.AAC.1
MRFSQKYLIIFLSLFAVKETESFSLANRPFGARRTTTTTLHGAPDAYVNSLSELSRLVVKSSTDTSSFQTVSYGNFNFGFGQSVTAGSITQKQINDIKDEADRVSASKSSQLLASTDISNDNDVTKTVEKLASDVAASKPTEQKVAEVVKEKTGMTVASSGEKSNIQLNEKIDAMTTSKSAPIETTVSKSGTPEISKPLEKADKTSELLASANTPKDTVAAKFAEKTVTDAPASKPVEAKVVEVANAASDKAKDVKTSSDVLVAKAADKPI